MENLFHKWRQIYSNCRYYSPSHFSLKMTYRIRLITEYAIFWATRRLSLIEQDFLTLPEHLKSSPVFDGIRFVQSFYFLYCVMCNVLYVVFHLLPCYCQFVFVNIPLVFFTFVLLCSCRVSGTVFVVVGIGISENNRNRYSSGSVSLH